MTYEQLLKEYENEVRVWERPLNYKFKGLYKDGMILISTKIKTNAEKSCILAEELGHHYTSSGDIVDQNDIRNIKQEHRARNWAYEKLIPLDDLIKVNLLRIQGNHNIAEYLNVTEEFLVASFKYYQNKYGTCHKTDKYIIYFEPYLGVMELFNQ